MRIAYKRVSTLAQKTDSQLAGMTFDMEYTEKVSAKDANRPKLIEMMEGLRAGDHVHCHDVSRLARSIKDLLDLVGEIREKGCSVTFHKEHLTFTPDESDHNSELMLGMIGVIAQFMRAMQNDRIRDGVAVAKERGVYKGKRSKFTEEQVVSFALEVKNGGKISKLAKAMGVTSKYMSRLLIKYNAGAPINYRVV